MLIQGRSPKLFGSLRRTFGSEALPRANRCFEIALANGGERELDYVRPEGMSFNPRPARVPLILLETNPSVTLETICAAILASMEPILEPEALRRALSEGGPIDAGKINAREIGELVVRSISAREILLDPSTAPHSRESIEISLALLLDRARHLHRAEKVSGAEIYRSLRSQLPSFLLLAEQVNPNLQRLLSAWQERAERLFSAAETGPEIETTATSAKRSDDPSEKARPVG